MQLESPHHCTSVVSKKSSMHIPLLNLLQIRYVDADNSKEARLYPGHANSPRLPWIAIED
jgi:hypothetical protein